ncbi:MAG: hypothetical protein ACKO6A_00370, partial [Bacteroidota bacterium]
MKKSLLVLMLLFAQFTHSQAVDSAKTQNIRSIKKLGLGLQLLGPTGFSIYGDYFVTHNFNFELGGFVLGDQMYCYYGGAKYYYGRKDKQQKFSPYIGIGAAQISALEELIVTINAPIGFQIMKNNGFQFSFELSAMYLSSIEGVIPWGAIKIGKNFG